MIRIGTKLHGYCGGRFGRDGYGLKRVEAIGADWVVARGSNDEIFFATVAPEKLEEFTKATPGDGCCDCEECR